jgi:L-threonylcarbamoyladenylate synthase
MQTLIVKTSEHADTHPDLDTLGCILADGHLVVFPTETVYGIAARRDSQEAVQRLREIKGRPPERPLTVHLADVADLDRLAAPLTPQVARIVRRLWPGPLSLVLPDLEGGHTGFRLPDSEIARALFRSAGVDLVGSSANETGEPPLVTPRKVVKRFREEVAGILTAGKARIGKPSTVVRIDGRVITILRDGATPAEDINLAACYDVVFVCTGNMCRSPMAEAMLKQRLAERLAVPEWGLRDLGINVHSAGTAGIEGGLATPDAQLAVKPYDADLSTHVSRGLTPEMIAHADVIYTATESHARMVEGIVPEAAERTRPMSADGADVPDPIGGPPDEYREVTDRIENALEEIVERTIYSAGLEAT